MLLSVKTYLQANVSELSGFEILFEGIRDNQDKQVGLFIESGRNVNGFRNSQLRVVVRNTTVADTEELAEIIYKILDNHKFTGVDIIEGTHTPIAVDLDQKKRARYVMRFMVIHNENDPIYHNT